MAESAIEIQMHVQPKRKSVQAIVGWVIGCGLILSSFPLASIGWQSLPPLLGIALIVFSLFGDIPQIKGLQWLGDQLAPGIIIGTIISLIPFLLPQGLSQYFLLPYLSITPTAETSLVAFSPSVWGAYISIIAVGIAFEISPLPLRLQKFCQSLASPPTLIIPLYVIIAGLLGNVFDGVTIIAISVIIFLTILPKVWAVEASFALLFGGLISNLITVAAEPTNIKYQDALAPLLDPLHPPFWFTNWPISILGIGLPAALLFVRMRSAKVAWYRGDAPVEATANEPIIAPSSEHFIVPISEPGVTLKKAPPVEETPAISKASNFFSAFLSSLALLLLGVGIITHAILQANLITQDGQTIEQPLWLLLAPAGLVAALQILVTRKLPSHILVELPVSRRTGQRYALTYLQEAWPVWGKIMIIFSLIWFISNTALSNENVFVAFFSLDGALRYGLMVILALLSSITDNVALAAMQGALIVHHPLAVWQIRLLLILLTWSGGLTYFGCLQSLALYSRLKMTPREWLRSSLPWAATAIIGGLVGLFFIGIFYPGL